MIYNFIIVKVRRGKGTRKITKHQDTRIQRKTNTGCRKVGEYKGMRGGEHKGAKGQRRKGIEGQRHRGTKRKRDKGTRRLHAGQAGRRTSNPRGLKGDPSLRSG